MLEILKAACNFKAVLIVFELSRIIDTLCSEYRSALENGARPELQNVTCEPVSADKSSGRGAGLALLGDPGGRRGRGTAGAVLSGRLPVAADTKGGTALSTTRSTADRTSRCRLWGPRRPGVKVGLREDGASQRGNVCPGI